MKESLRDAIKTALSLHFSGEDWKIEIAERFGMNIDDVYEAIKTVQDEPKEKEKSETLVVEKVEILRLLRLRENGPGIDYMCEMDDFLEKYREQVEEG